MMYRPKTMATRLAQAAALVALFAVSPAPAQAAAPQALIEQMTGQVEAPKRSTKAWQQAYGQVMDHLIPQLAADKRAERYEPQMTLEAITTYAHHPERAAQEQAVARVLADRVSDDEVPMAARLWIAQKLINFDGAAVVLALRDLLDHDNARLAERARQALQHNPSAEARKALIAALNEAEATSQRVALINALAGRDSATVTDALAGQLEAEDPAVIQAALRGLGRVGEAQTLKALKLKSVGKANEPARTRALLEIATRLAASGEADAARPVFEAFNVQGVPAAVRGAALRGKLLHQPKQAAALYRSVLTGDDQQLQKVALHVAGEGKGVATTQALVGVLPDLKPLMQQRVLQALADRGDPAAVESIVARIDATAKQHPEVAKAAIRTLGAIDTIESTNALLEIGPNEGPFGELITKQLAQTRNPEVIDHLRGMLSQTPAAKATAFTVLVEAGQRLPLAMVLRTLDSENANLIRAARRALMQQVQPEQLDELIEAFETTDSARVRHVVSQAIGAALGRANDLSAHSEALLAAYDRGSDQQKAMLLPLLARLGTAAAVQRAEAALRGQSEALQNAAIEALSRWPRFEAAQTLLSAARKVNDAARTAALRGLAEQVRNATAATAVEKFNTLRQAIKLAQGPDAKKALLSALGTVRSAAAISEAREQLDDPAVRTEAALAVMQIAQAWHFAPRSAVATAQRIAEAEVPDSIKQRARTFVESRHNTKAYAIAPQHLIDANGQGGALTGQYYQGTDFNEKRMTRRDSAFAFGWGESGTAGDVGNRHFSVRWTGRIKTPDSGTYTFAVRQDDGARLWVDGKKVIDAWSNGAPRTSIARVQLEANQNPTIKLEYYQGGGGAALHFGWRLPQPSVNSASNPFGRGDSWAMGTTITTGK
jgi:HEAT repeat protein